jgi:hypothetical protein
VIINEAGELLLEATINGDSGPVIGVPVSFSSSVGSTSFSDNNVKTDSSGTAQVYASNIMRNTTITATAGGISDTLNIVVNNPPIAVITLIQGTPETKRVNSLTFSAENSYDPDQGYGDTIETYTWGYSYKGEDPVPVETSNTTNSQIITYQIGDPTGETPDRGDVFTVILTVVDENGLQDTETYVITFL